MGMNRGEMSDEVASIVGRSGDTAFETRIDTYIYWTMMRIARRHDFKEARKIKTDLATTADVKTYELGGALASDWSITNVKTIHDMRLIDGANSRILVPKFYETVDANLPRPEQWSTGRPKHYVRWGNYIELIEHIPNDAYTIYIRYTVWPTEPSGDSSDLFYSNLDDVISCGTAAIAFNNIQQFDNALDKGIEAEGNFQLAVYADGYDPDMTFKGEGFDTKDAVTGQYWAKPFIMRSP